MLTYPRAVSLKNIKTSSRWIRMLDLKWLRWISTRIVRVNYLYLVGPVAPQTIKEEMQHIDGLMTEIWT